MDWNPIFLSLQLAAITSVLLFVLALPLARWLASGKQNWVKMMVETVVSLPLVLPPTVLGFYLLLAFSPQSGLGSFLKEYIGLDLVFSFWGLVIGSMVYSLPFMVRPIQSGLQNLPNNQTQAAYILGKSKWQTFFRIQLPNCKPALRTALVLTFAHTMGEFGVVLMIGGNIPGETRVASIAIYDQVEALQYASAHQYALVLLLISFVVMIGVQLLNRKKQKSVLP